MKKMRLVPIGPVDRRAPDVQTMILLRKLMQEKRVPIAANSQGIQTTTNEFTQVPIATNSQGIQTTTNEFTQTEATEQETQTVDLEDYIPQSTTNQPLVQPSIQSPIQHSAIQSPTEQNVQNAPDDSLTEKLLYRYSKFLKLVKKYTEAIEEEEYKESDDAEKVKLLREIEKEVAKF